MTSRMAAPSSLQPFFNHPPNSPFLSHSSVTTRLPAFSSPLLRWPKNGDGGRGIRVRVRAGYTKRKLETPGACEVIDEESGERVIVWGDDSSIPSKEVLSWKPNQQEKKSPRDDGGKKAPSCGGDNAVSGATSRRVASSFGRLKALNIRSRARHISQDKHETNSETYDEVDIEDSDLASDEDDDDEMLDSRNILNKRKTNISVKGGIDQLLDDEQSRKPFVSTSDVIGTGSNASVSHSRGWSSRDASRGPRDASRDQKYNQKYNQKYEGSRNEPREQKYFPKYSAGSDFFSRKSFKDLGCNDDMIGSLRAQNFLRPSHIQAMSYVPVMTGKSCIVADQSGSGKTLAYLAPVIQRLRQEEIEGLSKSASRSPRTVILVPTAELASQVLRNCRSISRNGVPFRSMVATGGFRQRTQLESLEQDLDVLIATPGRFTYLIKEGFLQLTNLRCAVLDEVDILFNDEEFEQALQILMNSAPVTTQYLFVTATLPVEIYNKLVEIFPDSEVIMGPGMHRTSSGLEEVLVDCSGNEGSEKTPETAFSNKKSALLKLAEENPVSRTIVFCNKIETCRKVENSLRRLDRKENQIQVLPFHAALEQETRITNMKNFLNQGREDRSLFLICTDRASRGIDFPSVDHVVLFDFPRDPSEYVRRVGRTARGAGGKGKAFVFVVGKQVSLARRIIERNLKGHPLHDVPSAYELVR